MIYGASLWSCELTLQLVTNRKSYASFWSASMTLKDLELSFSADNAPACMAGVKAGCAHLCRVAGNTVWSHMASDTP